MTQILTIDLYRHLEDRLGREEARKVVEAIEIVFEEMRKKAESLAVEKKLEIRDELTKELATKTDLLRVEAKFEGEIKSIRQEIQTVRQEIQTVRQEIQTVRQEIQTVKAEIEGKISNLKMEFRAYFVVIIAMIILSSPRAIDLVSRLLGVFK